MTSPPDPDGAKPTDAKPAGRGPDPAAIRRRNRYLRKLEQEKRWTQPLETRRQRWVAWLNSIFVDHAFFRAIYLNLHRVGARAWRAAQPMPHHIRAAAARGVRTIVSLRGGVGFGSYPLEREACADAGVAFRTFVLRSRDLPTREEIAALDAFLAEIETPILFHCKSGADRAGLMSALYLILAEGEPVETARRQLSLRYGHFSIGPTGVLDRFMAEAAAAEARGVPFRDWIETDYDREAIMARHKSSGLGRFLTDRSAAPGIAAPSEPQLA